ncbi:MAG: nitrite reductase (NAD(P)H) small subunit [Acetobacteraceae bacterium]|nr:nitrite reductase (NAD(P)H) small subunit [Acetobacteraceae bacterium]
MNEYPIGALAQIPKGEGRNFEVEGVKVAVFHTQRGEIFATQPDCPHRKGPLADGLVGESTVVCPLHDRSYDLKSGKELGADCVLKTYRVRTAPDGTIMLAL